MLKKKAKIKNLRSILESPFQNLCPENNPEEVNSIQEALKELLPAAKLEQEVRNNKLIQLKSNKKVKEKNKTESTHKNKNIYRTYLAPGFQSVLRGLEKKELCCVLLSNDITPVTIQKVVFGYAKAQSVPLIVIPDLKIITKSTLGFATMVLGFKKIVEAPENRFHPIYRIVVQNTNCPNSSILEEDEVKNNQKKSTSLVVKSSKLLSSTTETQHLYRKRIGERVFIPQIKVHDSKDYKIKDKTIENMHADFIKIGELPQSTDISVIQSEVMDCKNNSDEEDDSDSGEDVIFFVDNKPDKSLLKTETLHFRNHNSKQVADSVERQSKKNRNVQKLQKSHERNLVSGINKFKNGQKLNKNSTPSTSVFKSKQTDIIKGKKNIPNQRYFSVKFEPLKIKTITSNVKKTRRKKKSTA